MNVDLVKIANEAGGQLCDIPEPWVSVASYIDVRATVGGGFVVTVWDDKSDEFLYEVVWNTVEAVLKFLSSLK